MDRNFLYRIRQLWGGLWLVLGLLFTFAMSTITLIGGLLCAPFSRNMNPFTYMHVPFARGLRWLVYMPAGIHMKIDVSQAKRTPDDNRPTIVIGNHPSNTGLAAFVNALVCVADAPYRWVLKKELTRWVIGRALLAIKCGYDIDRSDPRQALARLTQAVIPDGNVAIFVDQTRPTTEKVDKAREQLMEDGRRAMVLRYLYTTLPKPGGFHKLLTQNPGARIVLIISGSSKRDDGFGDTVQFTLGGGRVFAKAVDLTDYEWPQDKAELYETLLRLFADMNSYIGSVRAGGSLHTPFHPNLPRRRAA